MIEISKTPAPVSAVIAAYNAEAFIAETIESVRAQTLPVAEILVVDDGSTDSTAEIARGMGARVISQENRGLAATRNRCVREASQPWIAFIDSDDLWEPQKIERRRQSGNRFGYLRLQHFYWVRGLVAVDSEQVRRRLPGAAKDEMRGWCGI
jgi:glycosyltransferase involved in cell wall biosynthesis